MSCTVEIKANVNQESSVSFGFSLIGKIGEAVTPNTFNWTLSDEDEEPVNSREDVSGTPAAKNWVDLKGDDLVLPDADAPLRTVAIYGTMDTERDGEAQLNEPYTFYIKFNVCDVPNIPTT